MKTFTERINAKHPKADEVSITENDCNTWARVYDSNFCYDYTVNAAGSLKMAFKRELGATEKVVRKQPLDTVIKIVKGQHEGMYYNGSTGNGWLRLVQTIEEAHKMSAYTAKNLISTLARDAQYCYGGRFEPQTV